MAQNNEWFNMEDWLKEIEKSADSRIKHLLNGQHLTDRGNALGFGAGSKDKTPENKQAFQAAASNSSANNAIHHLGTIITTLKNIGFDYQIVRKNNGNFEFQFFPHDNPNYHGKKPSIELGMPVNGPAGKLGVILKHNLPISNSLDVYVENGRGYLQTLTERALHTVASDLRSVHYANLTDPRKSSDERASYLSWMINKTISDVESAAPAVNSKYTQEETQKSKSVHERSIEGVAQISGQVTYSGFANDLAKRYTQAFGHDLDRAKTESIRLVDEAFKIRMATEDDRVFIQRMKSKFSSFFRGGKNQAMFAEILAATDMVKGIGINQSGVGEKTMGIVGIAGMSQPFESLLPSDSNKIKKNSAYYQNLVYKNSGQRIRHAAGKGAIFSTRSQRENFVNVQEPLRDTYYMVSMAEKYIQEAYEELHDKYTKMAGKGRMTERQFMDKFGSGIHGINLGGLVLSEALRNDFWSETPRRGSVSQARYDAEKVKAEEQMRQINEDFKKKHGHVKYDEATLKRKAESLARRNALELDRNERVGSFAVDPDTGLYVGEILKTDNAAQFKADIVSGTTRGVATFMNDELMGRAIEKSFIAAGFTDEKEIKKYIYVNGEDAKDGLRIQGMTQATAQIKAKNFYEMFGGAMRYVANEYVSQKEKARAAARAGLVTSALSKEDKRDFRKKDYESFVNSWLDYMVDNGYLPEDARKNHWLSVAEDQYGNPTIDVSSAFKLKDPKKAFLGLGAYGVEQKMFPTNPFTEDTKTGNLQVSPFLIQGHEIAKSSNSVIAGQRGAYAGYREMNAILRRIGMLRAAGYGKEADILTKFYTDRFAITELSQSKYQELLDEEKEMYFNNRSLVTPSSMNLKDKGRRKVLTLQDILGKGQLFSSEYDSDTGMMLNPYSMAATHIADEQRELLNANYGERKGASIFLDTGMQYITKSGHLGRYIQLPTISYESSKNANGQQVVQFDSPQRLLALNTLLRNLRDIDEDTSLSLEDRQIKVGEAVDAYTTAIGNDLHTSDGENSYTKAHRIHEAPGISGMEMTIATMDTLPKGSVYEQYEGAMDENTIVLHKQTFRQRLGKDLTKLKAQYKQIFGGDPDLSKAGSKPEQQIKWLQNQIIAASTIGGKDFKKDKGGIFGQAWRYPSSEGLDVSHIRYLVAASDKDVGRHTMLMTTGLAAKFHADNDSDKIRNLNMMASEMAAQGYSESEIAEVLAAEQVLWGIEARESQIMKNLNVKHAQGDLDFSDPKQTADAIIKAGDLKGKSKKKADDISLYMTKTGSKTIGLFSSVFQALEEVAMKSGLDESGIANSQDEEAIRNAFATSLLRAVDRAPTENGISAKKLSDHIKKGNVESWLTDLDELATDMQSGDSYRTITEFRGLLTRLQENEILNQDDSHVLVAKGDNYLQHMLVRWVNTAIESGNDIIFNILKEATGFKGSSKEEFKKAVESGVLGVSRGMLEASFLRFNTALDNDGKGVTVNGRRIHSIADIYENGNMWSFIPGHEKVENLYYPAGVDTTQMTEMQAQHYDELKKKVQKRKQNQKAFNIMMGLDDDDWQSFTSWKMLSRGAYEDSQYGHLYYTRPSQLGEPWAEYGRDKEKFSKEQQIAVTEQLLSYSIKDLLDSADDGDNRYYAFKNILNPRKNLYSIFMRGNIANVAQTLGKYGISMEQILQAAGVDPDALRSGTFDFSKLSFENMDFSKLGLSDAKLKKFEKEWNSDTTPRTASAFKEKVKKQIPDLFSKEDWKHASFNDITSALFTRMVEYQFDEPNRKIYADLYRQSDEISAGGSPKQRLELAARMAAIQNPKQAGHKFYQYATMIQRLSEQLGGYDVVGNEQGLIGFFSDVETGKNGQLKAGKTRMMRGSSDLILKDKETNKLVIADLKTTGYSTMSSVPIQYALQTMAYATSLQQLQDYIKKNKIKSLSDLKKDPQAGVYRLYERQFGDKPITAELFNALKTTEGIGELQILAANELGDVRKFVADWDKLSRLGTPKEVFYKALRASVNKDLLKTEEYQDLKDSADFQSLVDQFELQGPDAEYIQHVREKYENTPEGQLKTEFGEKKKAYLEARQRLKIAANSPLAGIEGTTAYEETKRALQDQEAIRSELLIMSGKLSDKEQQELQTLLETNDALRDQQELRDKIKEEEAARKENMQAFGSSMNDYVKLQQQSWRLDKQISRSSGAQKDILLGEKAIVDSYTNEAMESMKQAYEKMSEPEREQYKKRIADAQRSLTLSYAKEALGEEQPGVFSKLAAGMKGGLARTFGFGMLGYRFISSVYGTLKKVIGYAEQLDQVMVNIQIVTGRTREEAFKLMGSYNGLAKQLGSTTVEVANSANVWLRQGYSLSKVNDLITSSMYLSKLGMLDSATAAKDLTGIIKGFKLEVSDATNIVSKLTMIDQNAAVSAGNIATAMQQVSASAQQAGLDIDTTMGYISTIADVSQRDPSSVGASLRTIISRYGTVKAGAFAGMGIDNTGDDLENINDIEKVLRRLGISIRTNTMEFRALDDVLSEVAGRWNDLSSVERNAIATAFAGTRQRESFLILMSNFDKARELTRVAAESEGAAEAKYTAYLNSAEAATKRLQNAWESFAVSLRASNLTKGIKNVLSFVVEHLDSIITQIASIYLGIKSVRAVNVFTRNGGFGQFANKGFGFMDGYRFMLDPNDPQSIDRFRGLRKHKLAKAGMFFGKMEDYEMGEGSPKIKISSQLTDIIGILNAIKTNTGTTGTTPTAPPQGYTSFPTMTGTNGQQYFYDKGSGIWWDQSGKLVSAEDAKRNGLQPPELVGPLQQGPRQSVPQQRAAIGIGQRAKIGAVSGLVSGVTTGIGTALTLKDEDGEDASTEAKTASFFASAGLTTGITVLTSLIPGVGQVLGPILGPILGGFISKALGPWFAGLFDNEAVSRRERSKQASEMLDTIRGIRSDTTEMKDLAVSGEWSFDTYQKASTTATNMMTKLYASPEVALRMYNSLTGEDTANSGEALRKLESHIQSNFLSASPKERQEFVANWEAAQYAAENEYLFNSKEDERYTRKQSIQESGLSVSGAWGRENQYVRQFEKDNPDLVKLVGTTVYFTADTMEERIATARRLKSFLLHNGIDQKYNLVRNLDKYIADMSTAESEKTTSAKEQNEAAMRAAGSNLKFSTMGVQTLKDLGREGVGKMILEELNSMGGLYTYTESGDILQKQYAWSGSLNSLPEEIRTRIQEYINSDPTLGKLFMNNQGYTLREMQSGKVQNVSESAKRQYLQAFADALGISVSKLADQIDRFGDFSLEQLTKGYEGTKGDIESLTSIFTNMASATGLTADNVETILSKFPSLGKYLGDTASLAQAIYDDVSVLIEIQQQTVLNTILSNEEAFSNWKNNLAVELQDAIKGVDALAKANSGETFYEALLSLSPEDKANLESKFGTEIVGMLQDAWKSQYNNMQFAMSIAEGIFGTQASYLSKLYDIQLKNLESQKTALQQINSQREYENKLIDARNKLENAQKEKRQVYREGVGFVYEADQEAIRQAQKELDELDNQKTISELEVAIAELQSQKSWLDQDSERRSFANMEAMMSNIASNENGGLWGSVNALNQAINDILPEISAGIDKLVEARFEEKKEATAEERGRAVHDVAAYRDIMDFFVGVYDSDEGWGKNDYKRLKNLTSQFTEANGYSSDIVSFVQDLMGEFDNLVDLWENGKISWPELLKQGEAIESKISSIDSYYNSAIQRVIDSEAQLTNMGAKFENGGLIGEEDMLGKDYMLNHIQYSGAFNKAMDIDGVAGVYEDYAVMSNLLKEMRQYEAGYNRVMQSDGNFTKEDEQAYERYTTLLPKYNEKINAIALNLYDAYEGYYSEQQLRGALKNAFKDYDGTNKSAVTDLFYSELKGEAYVGVLDSVKQDLRKFGYTNGQFTESHDNTTINGLTVYSKADNFANLMRDILQVARTRSIK